MCKIYGLAVAAMLCAALAAPAGAHEQRKVGAYEMTVGWADEPAYVGYKNAVQLFLNDKAGKPINDLGDTLKVEVRFSGQTMGPLPLDPAYDPDAHVGVPGEYLAPVIPTRPGNYSFHFAGKIRNQSVDETFTTSEKTFDPVADPSTIEFPAKDPSRGELAMRIERLDPRIDAAQAGAREATGATAQLRGLAVTGIVLGAAGLLLGIASSRRRVTG